MYITDVTGVPEHKCICYLAAIVCLFGVLRRVHNSRWNESRLEALKFASKEMKPLEMKPL